jgi:DNA-binding HxlR family transcriptional regulator
MSPHKIGQERIFLGQGHMDETITIAPLSRECGALHELIGRLSARWTLPVALTLRCGPVRFNAIRRAVPGLSQQMLTRTLKTLERDGMVTRTVHPSVPPRVEYALTELGVALVEEGQRLGAWAQTHLEQVDSSRANYDRANQTPGDEKQDAPGSTIP